ncbi:hypothetical protein FRC09_008410 [Ceratobasidium sp. 395]|nr:hypothetical protein FRC09_008410 [Ceratobasidium sp. 395]
MSAKRNPATHYRVAGRDEPTVQVEKYRSTPPQQTKKSNGTKRRRKGPRIETFRAEGTLDSDAADTKLDLAHAPPDQKLADPSSSSAPLLDNVNDPPGPAAETNSPGITPPNRTNKTANQFLASWLVESSEGYLTAFYDNDSPPDTIICSVCQKPAIDLFRCRTCLGGCRCCSSCLLSAHRIHPTHRTERWDGQTWAATSLDNLGYVLHLGHQGQPCTVGNGSSALLVGDLNGFHTIRVHYCTHDNAAAKPIQLISAGLFPCSDVNPQSAFAISLLEIYNVFLTVGRTSAHKFYSVLERITKPGFPDDVKDRYRELMATHRKYLFLLNLQRAAHGFELHETDIHPGDQALDCAACPRPGINFDCPWFRAFVSYDGNFRSVRKNKKVDANDICLSDGKAYFAPKGPYKEWVKTQKTPQRSEKPACDRHKAGNDTSVRSTGKDITGIGALTCTSHSCFVPRGIVDYFQGELYIYLDYALACAVRHLSRGEPLPFGLTYDVWCHWIKKLWDRIPNLPPDLQLPDDFDLVGAIPKWHLIGHIIECHVRHSLDHKQHVGRMEGEGPERVWSNLNEHSGSTSEQGPGVRTDTINNLAYEWNYEKMIRFIQYLPHKCKEAKRMYIQQEAVHQDLSEGLPSTEVMLWEAAPIDPVEGPNKTWTSPLMDPVWTDGLFQKTVRAESQKESPTSRSPRGRPGVARWLSDAIELENHM